MKKKNIFSAEILKGYCPFCIVREETVLQYSLLVLDRIAESKARLYCNRQVCIASEVA